MQSLCRFRGMAVAVLVLSTVVSAAAAKYAGGSGTADDPYQIGTAADLILLGGSPQDYDKHFILTADIDLDPNLPGRKVFDKAVIAPDTDRTNDYVFTGTPFSGTLDGNGHRISHLRIKGGEYLGLFGQLTPLAEVKGLGMVDVNVAGSGPYVGGLAGSGGSATRCYTTGAVQGGEFVGGLMGDKSGAVSYCYSHCAAGGTGLVGGLLGSNTDGAVTRCYSTGAVSGTGLSFGGLVGLSNGGVLCSVWDTETSGRSGSAGGVGLTTAEMMDPYMLGLNGFGDDPNWVLRAGLDYPRLAWEESIPTPDINWLQGRGTADEPYRLDTAEQLIRLGHAGILSDRHFVLGADIDLDPNRTGVPPFSQAVIPSFSGVFDGNNHTISHLTIQGVGHLGLFGDLESGAEVKNLGVVNVNVLGSGNYVGGLAGVNRGTATRCYSTGTVRGTLSDTGGLVGNNNGGALISCHSNGSVTGRIHAGGLVGFNRGNVTECYSAGTVTSTGAGTGGLAGFNSGNAARCFSTSPVSGVGAVGGLVGQNLVTGRVLDCYSTGTIRGSQSVGGLIGSNAKGGFLGRCYSRGTVVGTKSSIGGLAGSNAGDVSACFWDIQTSGQATSGGGIGKTTAEMRTAGTFLATGWDFVGETANGSEDIWWINEGQDYPRLSWETAPK